jgi:hypothetical protein
MGKEIFIGVWDAAFNILPHLPGGGGSGAGCALTIYEVLQARPGPDRVVLDIHRCL